jgi:hypothetical protein
VDSLVFPSNWKKSKVEATPLRFGEGFKSVSNASGDEGAAATGFDVDFPFSKTAVPHAFPNPNRAPTGFTAESSRF